MPLVDWEISINRGILTGFNEAFIITGEKRKELIALDPKSDEIIRPILRGRDIKRYGYDFADLWLINTHNGNIDKGVSRVDVNEFPTIKSHLDCYYALLKERYDKGDTPYNLRSCAYMEDFYEQKIVWGEISDKPKFAIDLTGKYFIEATSFLMTGNSLEYILSVLNSKLSEYYFSTIGTTTGVGTIRWKKYKIETFPIPKLSTPEHFPYIELIGQILEVKKKGESSKELESMLDKKIYSLFGFTQTEIEVIER